MPQSRSTESDRVMNRTFWIGVYPGLTKDMLNYMIATIREGSQ